MCTRRLLGAGLLAWLSVLLVAAAPAHAQEEYSTKAPHAILIDARTGRVLFEKEADVPVPPASMSKMMTMIMVFEALKAGTITLDQQFTVSEDAWRRGGAVSGGSTR